MINVAIIGVGMTPFGKFLDKSLAGLGQVASRLFRLYLFAS